MKKTYLTDRQMAELVKEGNSIVSQSDFAKVKSIEKKYDIRLIYPKQANVQLWYNKIAELLQAEPSTSKFMVQQEEQKAYPLPVYRSDPKIISNYIKYLGIWDSEYVFLCSQRWDELQEFAVHRLGNLGVDTFGGATIYLKNGGDYYGHISKHGKKFCDPESLKQSSELKKTIDALFAGMETPEKMHTTNIIMEYVSTDMSSDEFHNALFAGR